MNIGEVYHEIYVQASLKPEACLLSSRKKHIYCLIAVADEALRRNGDLKPKRLGSFPRRSRVFGG